MKKLHRLLLIIMTAFLLLVPADAAFAAKKSSVIRPGESLQQVRTLSWKATLLRNVRTKYGRFRAGTVVTVVRGGAKCIIRLKGHNYSISRQYLSFGQDLASVVTKGDYNKLTKTTYINSTAHKSKSRYLVWVSLDKQRVNICRGKNKKWKLVKVFKCTTGRKLRYQGKVSELWQSCLLHGVLRQRISQMAGRGCGVHRNAYAVTRLHPDDAERYNLDV